jgi:ABC-2 type transport system ATP-binding protein
LRRVEVTVLENVNLQVKKGELFGLLGPNGAGKTTLIKILCTLIFPSDGTALINGNNIHKDGKAIRRTIGYVISEDRSFYWRLTGRQNLKFFAELNNYTKTEADRRISELLELTGLRDDADKLFKDYSSGMKQRLALSRALLASPEILFLDEPTKSLDPIAARDLKMFIRNRMVDEEKKTVVLATNNMQEAEDLCDRIAIMDHGRVKVCEALTEIKRILTKTKRYVLRFHGPLEHSRQALLRILPCRSIELLPSKPSLNNGSLFRIHIETGEESIADLIERMVGIGLKVEAFYPEELPLNEIFAQVVH